MPTIFLYRAKIANRENQRNESFIRYALQKIRVRIMSLSVDCKPLTSHSASWIQLVHLEIAWILSSHNQSSTQKLAVTAGLLQTQLFSVWVSPAGSAKILSFFIPDSANMFCSTIKWVSLDSQISWKKLDDIERWSMPDLKHVVITQDYGSSRTIVKFFVKEICPEARRHPSLQMVGQRGPKTVTYATFCTHGRCNYRPKHGPIYRYVRQILHPVYNRLVEQNPLENLWYCMQNWKCAWWVSIFLIQIGCDIGRSTSHHPRHSPALGRVSPDWETVANMWWGYSRDGTRHRR